MLEKWAQFALKFGEPILERYTNAVTWKLAIALSSWQAVEAMEGDPPRALEGTYRFEGCPYCYPEVLASCQRLLAS